MNRTPLSQRHLPDYTRGEEIFHMVSHIVGAGLAVVMLAICVVFAAIHGDAWDVVGNAVYGVSMVALYTMSAVYHGLRPGTGKKVMQVIDHCTIYFLIAGTYTPVLFGAIRPESPVTAWLLFGVVWGLAALAAALTAIDLKKYRVFSMVCYIGIGWCVVFAARQLIAAVALPGILLLLAGGIAYTVGAVLYGLGKKKRWMHGAFHLFCILGSVLQFFCILFYVILA